MTDAATSATAAGPVTTPPKPSSPPAGGFRRLLSELNPLQYIPVVGTIYRAITGDTIPETARMVGSFVVSGLEGGPIGLAINAAVTAVEKLTGFDPEKLGQGVLAEIGIGTKPAPVVAKAFTPAQLHAYRDTLTDSDRLNDRELARLRSGVTTIA